MAGGLRRPRRGGRYGAGTSYLVNRPGGLANIHSTSGIRGLGIWRLFRPDRRIAYTVIRLLTQP